MATNHLSSKYKSIAEDEPFQPGDALFADDEYIEIPDNWLQRTAQFLRAQGYMMKHVIPCRPTEPKEEGPGSPEIIIFHPNGKTIVTDENGNRIPKYMGTHADAIQALANDGISWEKLSSITGKPNA